MKHPKIFQILCLNIALLLAVSCQEHPYQQGKILYQNFCANCHMDDGTGLPGIIPPLAGADFLTLQTDELPCIIRQGLTGEIVVNGKKYSTEMPGSPALTEFEITNVINYLNHAWGNDFGAVKHEAVRKALKNCEVYEEMLRSKKE